MIFSETVEDYSTYKERAPTQAKVRRTVLSCCPGLVVYFYHRAVYIIARSLIACIAVPISEYFMHIWLNLMTCSVALQEICAVPMDGRQPNRVWSKDAHLRSRCTQELYIGV